MDTNVLINLKRRCEIKQKMPSAIYSKEFREQAVKQVTEEGLRGTFEIKIYDNWYRFGKGMRYTESPLAVALRT